MKVRVDAQDYRTRCVGAEQERNVVVRECNAATIYSNAAPGSSDAAAIYCSAAATAV